MTTMTEVRVTDHDFAVEVDTHLSEVWTASETARDRLASTRDYAHTQTGERPIYIGRRRAWRASHADAVEKLREMAQTDRMPFRRDEYQRTIDKIDELNAEAEALNAEARQFEEIVDWQRFFLVTNKNGHIHATMGCSTCRVTTRFAWLPTLSGLTEADAVAAHGARLCSVCFPTAPVEWRAE
jgi:hypothetical protein